MKVDLEVSIIDDGKRWIVKHGDFTATGVSLAELDDNLKDILIDSGKFEKGSTITVFMGYDYRNIPTWIRQYAYHYFNRLITLEL